jgi:hypothetical protein
MQVRCQELVDSKGEPQTLALEHVMLYHAKVVAFEEAADRVESLGYADLDFKDNITVGRGAFVFP